MLQAEQGRIGVLYELDGEMGNNSLPGQKNATLFTKNTVVLYEETIVRI